MMMMSDKNFLTNLEYNQIIDRVGELVTKYYRKETSSVNQYKINTHLTWIASLNITSSVDPTSIYNSADKLANDPLLFQFYTQLNFNLFSIGLNSQKDCYVRLCKSVARALPKTSSDPYGMNYQIHNGDLYVLAKQLYKKKLIDYFIKPSREKVLEHFLQNHRHVVLQIIIMQYYQLKL